MSLRHTLAAAVVLSSLASAKAQTPLASQRDDFDTAYVRDFSDRPTVRLYGSVKFNSMVVRSEPGFKDLRYRPNVNYNIGVGASYRKLTLNLGFPIPFLNSDDASRGRTRYLDAQATLHTQRQTSNLFLQVFKGYHITSYPPAEIGWDQSTDYPYRPDLFQFNIGLSSLRIANHERFSYRAAFNQDAWQQRTQGTWLYGGYGTCYIIKADSALVPSLLLHAFSSSAAISKGVLVDLGPMAGYAQTLVYRRHWFMTMSAALGLGISVQDLVVPGLEGSDKRTDIGPGWHAQLRGAVGYNSRYRYVGLLYNQERVGHILREQNRFVWDVGNVRLIVAQRLEQRPKRVDKGLRWLKKNTVLPVP